MFASGTVLLLLWTAPLYGGGSAPLGAGPSTGLGAGGEATGVAAPDAVARAIEEAVHVRVGRSITVSVTNLMGVRLARQPSSLVAVPDPSGRIGAPVRFVLSDGAAGQRRARVGEATATVLVTAPAVRARRAIARGARLEAEDIALLESDLSGRALRPLPSFGDTLGARAAHDIAEDVVVTHSDIVADPVIKAGEIVRAHVHVGDVELVGSVVAAENGMKDEVIRVVNQGSRYAFRARVIGTGEVEVVDVR